LQHAVQVRIRFYNERARECVDRLRREFDVAASSDETSRRAKLYYSGLLVEHSQREPAETFFTSVITRMLQRTYYDNDRSLVRAACGSQIVDVPVSCPPFVAYLQD
jgi:isocitrate dehydrogenase kinase/phosphatase